MTLRTIAFAAPLLLASLATDQTATAQVATEAHHLVPDNANPGDDFGSPIAIGDGLIAVGAYSGDAGGTDSGSLYVFDADTREQLYEIAPPDAGATPGFPRSVAIADGIIAVGVFDHDAAADDAGIVYLFDAATGAFLRQILPETPVVRGWFGYSLALADGLLFVGTPDEVSGRVHVYNAQTGAKVTTIGPVGPPFTHREFGSRIAVSGNILAVGDPQDWQNLTNAGAAHLIDTTTFLPLHRLTPDDPAPGDYFGGSLDIDGNVAIVGTGKVPPEGEIAPLAYLFDATTGQQFAALMPDDDGLFWDASGVAVGYGFAYVSARGRQGEGVSLPTDAGVIYVYDAQNGARVGKLLRTDSSSYEHFAVRITLGENILAASATDDDTNGLHAGAAFLYHATPCNPADIVPMFGVLAPDDIEAFVNGFLLDDPVADCDGSGSLSPDDIECFVTAFTTGCP